MKIFRRDQIEDYLRDHLDKIDTPQMLYELCIEDIEYDEIEEIFTEIKEESRECGPCGGAFDSWVDFWRYKEG